MAVLKLIFVRHGQEDATGRMTWEMRNQMLDLGSKLRERKIVTDAIASGDKPHVITSASILAKQFCLALHEPEPALFEDADIVDMCSRLQSGVFSGKCGVILVSTGPVIKAAVRAFTGQSIEINNGQAAIIDVDLSDVSGSCPLELVV